MGVRIRRSSLPIGAAPRAARGLEDSPRQSCPDNVAGGCPRALGAAPRAARMLEDSPRQSCPGNVAGGCPRAMVAAPRAAFQYQYYYYN